ncbi:MAG: hypothetical protein JWQ27_1336 [Ferruginibacter sp.]|nr:hypothetical protein [Ferruginibacter sp.]
MKINSILFAGMMLFAGCNNEKTTTSEQTGNTVTAPDAVPASPKETSPEDFSGCYRMIIEKDTATMKLSAAGSDFTGDLAYKRFEKDSNKGTVQLRRDGQYLKGWYRFNSEGEFSVRELIFRIQGANLEEGYGDVGVNKDSVYFKYPSNLNFENKHPFIKENCK